MMTEQTYNPDAAKIIAEDGTVFQVLNEAGDDWDEAATRAKYEAWQAARAKK